MSNKALGYVFTHSKTKGSARVLMLAIADMANDDGECYPGRANLAKKVNVSERQLSNLIRDCEVSGELRVYQRSHSAEDHRTNKYYIVGLFDEKRAANVRTAKPAKQRSFPKAKAEKEGHGKLVSLGGQVKRVAGGQMKPVADASPSGHVQPVSTNPSLTTLSIEPKNAAIAAQVVSPTVKAGSYQALSGKSDEECEAERIALAEQQRVIDERRLLGNGHVAQLEIDVKHFLGLSGTLATKYARMLYGRLSTKGKKPKPEDNAYLEQSALLRDAPITPDEFTGWAEEYCRTAKVTPGAPTMIKVPEKLVSSILARRERLAAGTSANASNYGASNWKEDFWDKFDGKVGA